MADLFVMSTEPAGDDLFFVSCRIIMLEFYYATKIAFQGHLIGIKRLIVCQKTLHLHH